MAMTESNLEGIIHSVLWFHYDLESDVLYLRLAAYRETATFAEETEDGLLLLRREDNDEPVGLTVVNWWKRFGKGTLPGEMEDLDRTVQKEAWDFAVSRGLLPT